MNPHGQEKNRRLEVYISPELAGVKVDTILKKHLNLSGAVVRRIKWLPDGILVDGQRVNTRFCPREGQLLSVRLSDPVLQFLNLHIDFHFLIELSSLFKLRTQSGNLFINLSISA